MISGIRLFAYAKTKSEAEAKLRQLKEEALSISSRENSPNISPKATEPSSKKSTETVSELIDLWLETSGFKPGTIQGYKYVIDEHINPNIGSIKLSNLSPAHIQKLYNQLREKPSIAEKVHRILHRCFDVGVLWGKLTENPCDRVVRPKYQIPVKSVWTREQLQVFLNSSKDHWLYPLWLLIVSTGCRLGEMLALRWSDVDLESGKMTVSRSVVWVQGEPVFSSPKTQAGIRVLQIPESVIKVLKGLRERNQDSELVFFGPKAGRPLHPSVVQHNLKRLCKQLNLPELTPHGLRHLHASLLLSNHIPVPLVSRQLGHANPGITMKIYAHAIDPGSEVARAIETVINGVEEKKGQDSA
jgi:integrase